MHRTSVIIAILGLFLLSAPVGGRAETQRITVTHTYVMGDSESRNEARAHCLTEAKRKIAEQAGAYVEVLSKTRNFQMDEDAVLSFTAALLRVTVEEEQFSLQNQHQAVTLTVTGEVDPEAVNRRLDELAERRLAARSGQGSLLDQMEKPLESEMSAPQRQSTPAPVPETTDNTNSRPAPKKVVQAKDPRAAKKRLHKSLEEATRLCVELTEPGMTRSEVNHLLGEPRARKQNRRYGLTGAQYGRLWVVYRDDIVACVRSRLEYRRNAGGLVHCEGFASNFVKR